MEPLGGPSLVRRHMRILMHVTPKQGASHRTKMRVKEHGPMFEVMDQAAFNGSGPLFSRDCLLLKSNMGWHGWLPVDEIDTSKPRGMVC